MKKWQKICFAVYFIGCLDFVLFWYMLLSSAPHAQNGIFDNGPIVTFGIFTLLLIFISLPGLITLAIVLLINLKRNRKDRKGKIEKYAFYDVDTLKKYRGNVCPICHLKMNKLRKLLECTNCQKVYKITSIYWEEPKQN